MDKELVEKYLSRDVMIVLKNNFKYYGTIKEIYDTSLSFIDIHKDEIAISFEDITIIKEAKLIR